MYGPDGNYAWWTKMRSGKHHLTTLSKGDKIYPACAPDVRWKNGSRFGWEVIMKAAENVPENACQTCQRHMVVWGML